MEFSQVNYFAAGLSTVLAFTLGMLWYSPLLFANAWISGRGYTEGDLEGMQAGMMPTYALTLCLLVRDGDDTGRGGASLRRGRGHDPARWLAFLVRLFGHANPHFSPTTGTGPRFVG